MSVFWRGELWDIGWNVDDGATYYPFELISRAELPDPQFDWNPHYGPGATGSDANGGSNRNFFQMVRGKWSLVGSFPDMTLFTGRLLQFPLGKFTNAVTNHISRGYVNIPEIFVRADYYTINDTNNAVALQFRRFFKNGKVNRASIQGAAGEPLTLSLNEVIFLSMLQSGTNDTVDGGGDHPTGNDTYLAVGTENDISRTDLEDSQPYFFSYGTIIFNGNTIAEVTGFEIEINNNIEPKYYITRLGHHARLPKELREGRREYRARFNVDVKDYILYNEMIGEGYEADGTHGGYALSGFQIDMWFCKDAAAPGASTNYIRFTLPGNTPDGLPNSQGCFITRAPHNITDQNMTNITMEIIFRDMTTTVEDPNATNYPTPA